jgi:hypothetical protein
LRDKAKEARHQGLVIEFQQEAIDVLVRELKCDRVSGLMYREGPKSLSIMTGRGMKYSQDEKR